MSFLFLRSEPLARWNLVLREASKLPQGLRTVFAFKLVEERLGASLSSLMRFAGSNPSEDNLRAFREELRGTEESNHELLVLMSRAVGTLGKMEERERVDLQQFLDRSGIYKLNETVCSPKRMLRKCSFTQPLFTQITYVL